MKKNLLILFCTILCFNKINSQINWELLNPMTTNTGKDVEFVTTNIGYIITTNELLETIDAGNTWLKKQNISSGNDISFYNTTGYIVGNDGYVLKSINNGASWNQISTGFNSSFNTVNIIDDDNIILSTSNSIVITNNGGTTWGTLSVPNSSVNKTFFTNNLIGHAVCNGGTILKTVDGGQNWYTIQGTNSFPSNFISVYFINENIGFASGENDYIFKTTDAGETWIQISDPSIDIYGFYFLDENNGFASGEYGATYKTIDGGNSWSPIFFQSGFVQGTNIYGIYFQDSNIGFITGLNGRIMKTIDGGNTWAQYSITSNLNTIQFLDDNIGYTNSGRNFYKTLNGGNSWTNVGSIDSFISIPRFTFVNENLGFAISGGTYGGQVFKTINGGVTWSFLIDLFEYGGSSITFLDENTGFASGGAGSNSYSRKVMKTIDGGDNWTQVLSQVSFGQIQFVNNMVGYGNRIGNSNGRMYKTTDGGTTWNISIELDDKNINSFYFTDKNDGFFIGDEGIIYQTSNGGTNWQKLNVLYENYRLIGFHNKNVGFVRGESGRIYKTEDGGLSWNLDSTIHGVNDLHIINNKIYLAGTYGKIYKKQSKGVLATNNFSNIKRTLVYPNPAEGYIKLLNTDISDKINSIEIYNIIGQKVCIENITNQSEIRIDLSNFKKGIYFIEVNFESKQKELSKLIFK
jgi:photosystem II stability/assembly factor-like uncharacterized protein